MTLSVTGPLASTVGAINPLRYRGYYYDSGTGFYYLQSRYYDPETGRFLNADGYVQTGQGINSTNMFSYCGNNPVNRTDSNGMFWKEIKNFFKSIFGAGSSTVTEYKTPDLKLPVYFPLTIDTGEKVTTTKSERGSSSKPVSVYSTKCINRPIKSSSAGLKLNIDKVSIDFSFGLDNLGATLSYTNGDTSNSSALIVNIAEAKIGFEASNSKYSFNQQKEPLCATSYTNVSVNGIGLLILIAVSILNPGSEASDKQFVPAPVY